MKPNKKNLGIACLLSAAAFLGCADASASGEMVVRNITYNVDTLAHMKVGPGTTTTSLRLTSESASQLQVHYLTIDRSTPGVSIRAVSAKDKVAGTEKVSTMGARKSDASHFYFAGANADFFLTKGTCTNGSSQVGTSSTSCVIDGEVFKTSASQQQFSIDRDGIARIGRLNYYKGTAKIGDKMTLFKGINVTSAKDGITLYTYRYWGSSNRTELADSCYEVTAKLVEGDTFAAGGKYRLEVTSEPNQSGDTSIPSDGFVIHASGYATTDSTVAASEFVAALKPGDIVEFDNVILLGNQRIYPQQIVSGNPKNVGGGLTLDTEADRADAVQLHPRTGIGFTQTGDTIIMMVVEGRHSASAGVRTSQLADIMRYAGAYEAVNLDGGGSSTLYTSAFGVRNYCSDGNERAVGNGIFAVYEGEDYKDTEITEIRFADWAPRLPIHASYTPCILGFNKHGVLVSDSISGYTLETEAKGGEIINDGATLRTLKNQGYFTLKATYNGCTAEVPYLVDNSCTFSPRNASILIDNKHTHAIELQAFNGVRIIPVDATVFSWSTSDAAVATVSADGVISGVSNGTATIVGELGDAKTEVTVTVENAPAPAVNIFADFVADDWKMTATGCDADATTLAKKGNGVEVNYKVKSTRGLAISLAPVAEKILWGLPDAIQVKLKSSKALKAVIVNYEDAVGGRHAISCGAVVAGESFDYTVDVTKYNNTPDVTAYPLQFKSISCSPSASTGDVATIEISELNLIYSDGAGVESVAVDGGANGFSGEPQYFNLQGIKIAKPAAGLCIERRGSVAKIILVK